MNRFIFVVLMLLFVPCIGFAAGILEQNEISVGESPSAVLQSDIASGASVKAKGITEEQRQKTLQYIAKIDAYLGKYPKDPRAYDDRAKAYCYLGEYQKAIESYTAIIELYPRIPYPYYFRSSCYFELNDYHNTIRDLEKFLELKADDTYIMCLLVIAYMTINNPEKAKYYLDNAIAIAPNKDYVNEAGGFFLEAKKDYTGALEKYERAKELYANSGKFSQKNLRRIECSIDAVKRKMRK